MEKHDIEGPKINCKVGRCENTLLHKATGNWKCYSGGAIVTDRGLRIVMETADNG